MVFLYPPPEYFTHISKNRQDAEYKLLDECTFVQCVDTYLDYYRLPDTQDILSEHMGFNPSQKNWDRYAYTLQQRTIVKDVWDAYVMDSKGFDVLHLGRAKGALNAYKLIYKHFLTILKTRKK